MTSGIFISYRRSDSKSDARSICQRLERTFGKGKVFIDVDLIRPGKNFQSVLKDDLEKCTGMVVVIGPRWLQLLKSSGPADTETGHDYVRLEVASALERNLPVFPVLVDGAVMPDAKDLPDDLKPLAFQQALSVRHDSFPRDMSGLEQELRRSIPTRGDLEGRRNFRTIPHIVRRDFLLCLAVSTHAGNDILQGRKFRVLWWSGVSRQLARGSTALCSVRMQFRQDVRRRLPGSRSQETIENRHSRHPGHEPGQ